MVKSSTSFVLLLGAIFAQMIPAHSSNSDNQTWDRRFELPDFDKDDFNGNFNGKLHGTFVTNKYKLYYDKDDDLEFTWIKTNDNIKMKISSDGSINQNWRFEDVKIDLEHNSDGSINQTWDFGSTKYTCNKSTDGKWSRQWADGKENPVTLKSYQELINEWCAENDFLLADKKQCIIY